MSMETTQVSKAKTARLSKFGPGDGLLGTITEAATAPIQVGAILWGLGVAEVKMARRLARQGIVSMQVRIDGPDFNDDYRRNAIYNSLGVSLCEAAMDKLAAERDVTAFILMGNCACANVCFNAAVTDPRVMGLILTNPYVSQAQILSVSIWRKILRLKTWKRLFAGKAQLKADLKRLQAVVAGKFKGENEAVVARSPMTAYDYRQDINLPADFDEKLQYVAKRGAKILIVAEKSEDGFYYIKKNYRKTLDTLRELSMLSIEEVAGDSHIFSANDAAASVLNDIISKWIDTTFSRDVLG